MKDYLDQAADLKRKLGNIRALDDHEIPIEPVRATEYDKDGVGVNLIYTVDEWLTTTRRRLLQKKDNEEQNRRRTENKEKMMMQETLKSIPRNKLIPLDSRRVFLPWHASYEELKESIRKAGVKDWKQHVLKIAKESLKIPQDSEACLYLSCLPSPELRISQVASR